MSGLEVVGVVLAILPLLISATEHYRGGRNFIARASQKEFLTAQYRDELIEQRLLLKLYVKGVVGRTDLPHDVQAEVAENPGGDAWKNAKVIHSMAEELGEAHELFSKVIERVSRVLSKFVRSEDKQDSNVTNQLRKLYDSSLAYIDVETALLGIWNRLKFSWKSSEWEAIIQELQHCNKSLRELSFAADRAKPFVKKQKTKNVHIAFGHRSNAEKLFRILNKACSCQPAGLQEIGLRLQASLTSAEPIKMQGSMFRILIVDATNATYEISAGVEMVPGYSASKSGSIEDSQTSSKQDANMKLLNDICSETRAAHAVRAHLHLFADHTEQVYCSCVKPVKYTSIQPTKKSFTSLSQVLKDCQAYSTKRWLHKEKSILAINLAYSLLQLHGGPWYSRWSAKNITFINEESHVVTEGGTNQVSLRQPYTRFPVCEIPQDPSPEVSVNQMKRMKRRSKRNGHLHALGILLMELYLGYSIEELAEAEETDDLRALAQDLLEEHADDFSMSREYLEAVRFCLIPRPNPQNGSFDFHDEGFREVYYSEVLAMLEENLMHNYDATESTWLLAD